MVALDMGTIPPTSVVQNEAQRRSQRVMLKGPWSF